ncbi:MAG: UDP-N-acetylmuramoyl-tripeptide--D-alanyl-D-alanine ligase [Proteobacteria bacterium]|nr:UDP-N-acetylmuramoyl-tripeptide--D-alanyl-D-alanine ligase [Pseudomonadota bacterium]
MTLSLLVEELGGELTGADLEFSCLSTDTRTLARGSLYLALAGNNFDGDEFVTDAAEKGACAAVVSRELESTIPTLRVVDTHVALGKISALNRKRSRAKVIALTGSQGKTTVKEMLGAILSAAGETLITQANLNNTIGVPLTLLDLEPGHDYAVIEMGANTAGEIGFSAGLTQPDIALITNASAAHIEGFGSLEGIVSAKGEIIDALGAQGLLILNADDAHVHDWIRRAGSRRTVLFSTDRGRENADYSCSDIARGAGGRVSFNLITPMGQRRIAIKLLGVHNVANSVAAAATAIEAGASLDQVESGLASLQPVLGRMHPMVGVNDSCLIDDSYNASPSSFRAAIDVLGSCSGLRFLIAGDMKEMGKASESAHSAVGEYAAKAGIDKLWAVGEQSEFTVKAFGAGGRHFSKMGELMTACQDIASSDVTFLVKGSRGAGMDAVVDVLRASEEF